MIRFVTHPLPFISSLFLGIDYSKLETYPELKEKMPYYPETKDHDSIEGVLDINLENEMQAVVEPGDEFYNEFSEIMVATFNHQKVSVIEEERVY